MKMSWLAWFSLCTSLPFTVSAAPVLTLTPPSLSGLPGTTKGWGFTIANDEGYVEVTSAHFCLAPLSFPACGAPVSGVFTDFISGFNNVIVGPPGGTLPDSVTQVFSLAGQTGIGSFEIGALSPLTTLDSGFIVLTYNLTNLDPNDANAEFLGSFLLSAEASVLVTSGDPDPVPVPEPTAGLLVVIALVGMRLVRRQGAR